MSKRSKQNRNKRTSKKRSNRGGSPNKPEDPKQASFAIETLEPRILLSATWVDADAPDADADAHDADNHDADFNMAAPPEGNDADGGGDDSGLFGDIVGDTVTIESPDSAPEAEGETPADNDADQPDEPAQADDQPSDDQPGGEVVGDGAENQNEVAEVDDAEPDGDAPNAEDTSATKSGEEVAESSDAESDASDDGQVQDAEDGQPADDDSDDQVSSGVPDEPTNDPLKVVLIDSTLDDVQTLRDSVDSDAVIIEYDGNNTSMADVLAQVEGLSESQDAQIESLSILSHGAGGQFDLGNETVTDEMSAEQRAAWQSLADNFTEGGNIYAYGCNVVDGSGEGQQLLNLLSGLTGTEVFGSDDITGAGGDWQLESVSSGGEAELAAGFTTELNTAALADYEFDLADYAETAFSGTQTFTDGDVTFTVSVTGSGTIDFTYDGSTDTLTITDNDGTNGSTAVSITQSGRDSLTIDQITLDSDIGSLTTDTDINTLNVHHNVDIDSITVGGGGGTISTFAYTGGGNVWNSPLTVNANIGSMTAQEIGTDITINGNVGSISVVDDVTLDKTFTINGNVNSFSIGDDLWNNADVVVTGKVGSFSTGGAIASGSTLTIGGNTHSLSFNEMDGTVSIAGDLNQVTATNVDGTISADAVKDFFTLTDTGYSFEGSFDEATAVVYNGATNTLTADGEAPPTADAGADQSVNDGGNVTLDATGSSDADGDALNYTWTQTGGPSVTLSDANASQPTFSAPSGANTTLTFQVAVNDGTTTTYDTVTITVNDVDDAPNASAGGDQTVDEGDNVTLDASGSSDPEGDGLTYTWTQTGGPTVSLSDANAAQPTFAAPESTSNTTLTFQVAVSDGTNTSYDTMTVNVNADNDAPSASAGIDQTVDEGDNVTLDASGSNDPEGEGLTYTWTQTGGPTVSLSDANAAQPTFATPSISSDATLTFQVAVTDGTNTSYDTVTVNVTAGADPDGTVTWDGEAVGDDDFSNDVNWTGDDAPDSDETLVFNATSTENAELDSDFGDTIGGLHLDSGYTGTVSLSQDIVIEGDLILSSGRLDLNGHTITVTGNVIIDGGDFQHESGTLVFSGSGDQSFSADGGEVGNLTVNKPGGTLTIDEDLVVTNDYSVTAGTVDATGATMEFQGYNRDIDAGSTTFGNVVLDVSGTTDFDSEMNITGNLTIENADNFNGSSINVSGNVIANEASMGGSTVISLDGTGDQSISGTGELSNVSINKASGTATFTQDMTISGDFTHVAGTVDASSVTIEFEGYQTNIDAHGVTFGDVVLDVSGTTDIVSDLNVDGNLTIENADNFNGNAVNVTGDVVTNEASIGGSTVFTLNGTGDQSISGTGELSNVSINKASGTATFTQDMTISGDFTHVAGTVDASSVTIEFEGYQTNIDANGVTFGDVVLDVSGTTDIVSDLNVDGNLTIENADNFNGNAVNVTGDVVTNESSIGGSTVISLNGTGDQSISGTGELSNVSINKASGTATFTQDMTISGDFTHVAGTVDASSVTIEFEGYQTNIDANGVTFGDVVLDVSGTTDIVSDLNADGNLTIENADNFNGNAVNVMGDVVTNESSIGGSTVFTLNGTGDQSISGIGELSNVSINKPSGTATFTQDMIISGDFTHVAGTVDASSVTIEFEGYQTNIDANGVTFGDVVLDVSGTTDIVSDLNVDGNLTIENADNFNGNAVNVTGDVVTNESSIGGSTVISLNGTGDQSISGTGELSNVSINKASGTATFTQDMIISGDFTHVAGTVDASSVTIEFEGYQTNIDANGVTFGDVVLDVSGTTDIVSDLNVDGNLTIQNADNFNGNAINVTGNLVSVEPSIGGSTVFTLNGTGDQNIYGTGEISNLTINKPSGTATFTQDMTISGDFTHVTGTVDASSVTVEFEGYQTDIDANGITFGNVVLDVSGTTDFVSDLNVDGNLTIENADNFNSNSINVTGNVVTNEPSIGGSTVLTLNGSGVQTISGGGELNNLVINKPDGTLTFMEDIILTGDFTHLAGDVNAGGVSIEFEGYNTDINAGSIVFGDVVLDVSGTTEFTGFFVVDGDLTINSAATLNGGKVWVSGSLNEIDSSYSGSTEFVVGRLPSPNPPVAHAGSDLTAAEGTTITLGGGGAGTAPSGLVANWQFSGDVSDSSDSGLSSALQNGDGDEFANDGTITFDGDDDMIRADAPELTGDYTTSVWIKPDATQNPWAGIYAATDASGNTNHWNLQFDNNAERNIVVYHDGNQKWDTGIDLSDVAGEWHELVIVRDGDSMSAYLDGELVNSGTWSVDPKGGADHLNIGGERTASSDYLYTGEIDDIQVYNRALSSGERSTLTPGPSTGTDVDNDALTYTWTQLSGPPVTLSDPSAALPQFEAPDVTGTTTLTFQVAVTDGTWTSYDTIDVLIENDNVAADADAGVDQTVAEGSTVTLDGSGTSDANNDTLQLTWRQTGGPNVTLSDTHGVQPTFEAPDVDEPTTITFEVLVNDGEVITTDTVTITVEPQDDFFLSPAPNLTVNEGESVSLHAYAGNTESVNFNESNITSYGGSQQDKDVTVSLEDDGDTMHLTGNGWKDVDFPYTVTENTILEFDFKVTATGEIHGIGFDNDDGISENRTFQLHGTQNWGIDGFNMDEVEEGEWVHVRIPVGEFFTGDFDKLVFANDHDDGARNAETFFSNLRVYEQDDMPTGVTYTWTQVGGPSVTLTDGNSASPTFDAPDIDEPTTLTFEVQASDGSTTRTEFVEVTVNPVEEAEFTVMAGPDLNVYENSNVSLHAFGGFAETINFETGGVTSYGGANQDVDVVTEFADGGSTLHMTGNGWKDVDFPYTVTENTILEFDFKVTETGEIHGIGFDTDDSISENRTFQLHGTQDWGIDDYSLANVREGEWVHVRIPVGEFYTGDFDKLFFTNDHDGGARDAESFFSNVRVYESDDMPENVTYTWTQTGGPSVSLTGGDSASPTFESPDVDEPTTLTFEVEASDGTTTRTDVVQVTVNPTTDPLLSVSAGEDQSVSGNTAVTLNGSGSATTSITFNGSGISSYGGSSQDVNADVSVEDGGSTLHLTGNGWKDYDFPYTVTEDTILEFEFRSTATGEIHGIGFDSDDNLSEDKAFTLHGTQNWGINDFKDYAGQEGEWVRYRIPVGEFYTGDFDRLFFVNDHDSGAGDAESFFRNINVYEDGATGSELTYTWTQTSGPTVDLDDPHSLNPTFTTPTDVTNTTLSFQLAVSDGSNTVYDTVDIFVEGSEVSPTASAGDDVTTTAGEAVNLNSTGSSNPTGSDLTFEWRQISGPSVDLDDATNPVTSFTAPFVDEMMELEFEVAVSNGDAVSVDTVTVTVTPNGLVVDGSPTDGSQSGVNVGQESNGDSGNGSQTGNDGGTEAPTQNSGGSNQQPTSGFVNVPENNSGSSSPLDSSGGTGTGDSGTGQNGSSGSDPQPGEDSGTLTGNRPNGSSGESDGRSANAIGNNNGGFDNDSDDAIARNDDPRQPIGFDQSTPIGDSGGTEASDGNGRTGSEGTAGEQTERLDRTGNRNDQPRDVKGNVERMPRSIDRNDDSSNDGATGDEVSPWNGSEDLRMLDPTGDNQEVFMQNQHEADARAAILDAQKEFESQKQNLENQFDLEGDVVFSNKNLTFGEPDAAFTIDEDVSTFEHVFDQVIKGSAIPLVPLTDGSNLITRTSGDETDSESGQSNRRRGQRNDQQGTSGTTIRSGRVTADSTGEQQEDEATTTESSSGFLTRLWLAVRGFSFKKRSDDENRNNERNR